jgi:hypothetical protein
MFDIDQTIRERRSTRMFLPQRPVPRALLLNGLSPWPSMLRRIAISSRSGCVHNRTGSRRLGF